MKTILSRINLNKNFYFLGKRQDLELALKSIKGIYYQLESANQLKFYPRISWGTLSMIGFEINVHAFLSDVEEGGLKFNFKTHLRYEHLFLVILFLIIFSVFEQKSIWQSVGLIGLWIVFHLCSQVVFRYQENKVIDSVVEKLKLKKNVTILHKNGC